MTFIYTLVPSIVMALAALGMFVLATVRLRSVEKPLAVQGIITDAQKQETDERQGVLASAKYWMDENKVLRDRLTAAEEKLGGLEKQLLAIAASCLDDQRVREAKYVADIIERDRLITKLTLDNSSLLARCPA